MSVNYNVQADVINIMNDFPQQGDIFLVDTNIWYWLTYPPASFSLDTSMHQSNYSNYITDTFTADATLCCSGLSLAELAHIIEREEKKLSSYSSSRTKEYRHNYPSERATVVSQVTAAWNQVKSIFALQISVELNEDTVNDALIQFSNQCLDGYDLFILESMKQESINKIITDDGDYVTVSGIEVFTANPRVIAAAQSQGKLKNR